MSRMVTEDEVRRVINRAKNKKAFGIDGIPNEVLKNETMVALLTKLFQFSFENGIVPSLWKKAIIKPIPKSSRDDPRMPLNYRGISFDKLCFKDINKCFERSHY